MDKSKLWESLLVGNLIIALRERAGSGQIKDTYTQRDGRSFTLRLGEVSREQEGREGKVLFHAIRIGNWWR